MRLDGDDAKLARFVPARQKLIQACRLVATVVSDPSVPVNPKSVAKSTGMPLEMVRYVMNSDEFSEILREATKSRVGGILSRLASLTEADIESEHFRLNPKLRLEAARTWSQVYERLAKAAPAHEDQIAQQQITVLMDEIQSGVFARKELTDETKSSWKHSDHQESQALGQDGGGPGAGPQEPE